MPFCCHDYTMNSDFIPHPEESFGDVFAEIVLNHNSSMFPVKIRETQKRARSTIFGASSF